MTIDLETATQIGVAAVVGAAVGLERQASGHAIGSGARFGGVRTFTLLGAAAGVAGVLWTHGFGGLAIVLLAAGAAIVVAGYVAASRRDVDATTEVSAVMVLAAGALSGAGQAALASALGAITVLLLVEKSRLHRFARRIDDAEARAGARFAVMATVVLPLLPTGPYGPFGSIRPRELWAMVLVLSGVSFAGYIARRAVGPGRGAVVTGLLAGIVSSTSATLSMARDSRSARGRSVELALGAIAASTVMFARLCLVVGALNPPLGVEVAWLLAAPLAGGAAMMAVGLRVARDGGRTSTDQRNPLQLASALQLAALFQVVLFAVQWAKLRFGDAGMLASGAVLGLADTDALALSVARSSTTEDALAVGAAALAVGALSNTLVKLAIAVVVGSPAFRLVAGLGLVALAGLTAAAVALAGAW